MSDCPYKFAIHPGIIYGGPLANRPGWGDIQFIGYDALVKAYDLDPKDCVSWAAKYTRISGPAFIRHYVHLHPVEDGQYAEALIKAILRHEVVKESYKKEQQLSKKDRISQPLMPLGIWIDELTDTFGRKVK